MSAAQAVLHAVALAHTRAPAQAPAVAAVHVPVPEQYDVGVKVEPLQEAAAPHDVVDAACTQAPVLSHAPVFPQVVDTVHALPQQVPLTQKPLMHSVAALHDRPLAFFAQLFVLPEPWQVKGDTQLVSAVHEVRQAPAEQT